MAQCVISIKVSVAWWWPLYAYGMVFTSMITGLEPDMTKVDRMARRAMRITIE